jgi:hypothetical protein
METITEKIKSYGPILIISITLFLSVFIFSYYFKSSRTKPTNVITVYGLGTKDFSSDLVVWDGSFSRKDMDLKSAYENLDKDREIIKKYFNEQGINEKEIVYSAIEIAKETEQFYEKNGAVSNKFTGFKLTQHVTIQSTNVDKIEEVSRRITQLINSGVEFYSDSPQYYYTKLADLKLEMIAMAAEDGYKRAKAVAEKSNARLGKLKSAATDVFQITAQYSSETYTYGGVYNTSSRNKTATITIKAEYGIE